MTIFGPFCLLSMRRRKRARENECENASKSEKNKQEKILLLPSFLFPFFLLPDFGRRLGLDFALDKLAALGQGVEPERAGEAAELLGAK